MCISSVNKDGIDTATQLLKQKTGTRHLPPAFTDNATVERASKRILPPFSQSPIALPMCG